jgi:hypothetical protein
MHNWNVREQSLKLPFSKRLFYYSPLSPLVLVANSLSSDLYISHKRGWTVTRFVGPYDHCNLCIDVPWPPLATLATSLSNCFGGVGLLFVSVQSKHQNSVSV